MVKAMVYSGEQQSKKIQQLKEERSLSLVNVLFAFGYHVHVSVCRERKLYEKCRAEYQVLMQELHACWSSCSHPQFLPRNTVDGYKVNIKVIQRHWNDPASMNDEKQV